MYIQPNIYILFLYIVSLFNAQILTKPKIGKKIWRGGRDLSANLLVKNEVGILLFGISSLNVVSKSCNDNQ